MSQDLDKRRESSVSAGFNKDDLEWEYYLKKWFKDNSHYRSRDFTIFFEELTKFSTGAKNAGYQIKVISDNLIVKRQCGPSRVNQRVAVVEITFP